MMIRLCEEKDIASVGAFYDTVVKNLCENINYPKWVYKVYPSEDSVREKTGAGCQFMCIENDAVIGAFVLNDDPDGKYENVKWSVDLNKGEYMVCHTLATDPALQGRGIGKRLVEYCVEFAKSHGFKGIRLDVVPENVPARRLYEKCGFRYAGDVDLERDIPEIPEFSMYELDFTE